MENKKLIFKSMLIFISYFVYSAIQTLPFDILGINYYSLDLNFKVMYTLLYELTYILIIVLLYASTFRENFKDYIKNFKTYMLNYMEYWALAFTLMIVSNYIIRLLFPSSVATNQENLNMLFEKAPIYIIISSIIYAPIIEESIFRLSLRNIFKSDKLFIFMSGFVFGALHVVSSFNSWQDLIYIISYSIPGFVFSYTLVKSKNIFIPISLHLFHNSFMIIVQIALMFLI